MFCRKQIPAAKRLLWSTTTTRGSTAASSFHRLNQSQLLQQQQVQSYAPPLLSNLRYYSQSVPVLMDKDDNEGGESDNNNSDYETINISGMSEEEIDAVFEEEEVRLKEEREARLGISDDKNWKPGMRKRPLQFSHNLQDFLYELEPENHDERWTLRDKRCGGLAIKVGMMPVFDEWGVRHPCTVLYMDQNVVLGHKTEDKHGYCAVQVAAGQRKRKNVGVSVLGQYKHILDDDDDNDDSLENPPYLVREFRVTDASCLIPIGSPIHARHFVPGQNIDVSGTSKGKGFQGAMKRHGFAGMPATHGVSKSHRSLGSTGQCQDPGKVFKGKKMAGRMGGTRVTMQNLQVLQVDRGRNLLYVKGAVPGNKGGFVEIRDAVKKPLWGTDHVLDKMMRPPLPTFDFDPVLDGSGEAGHEVFMPLPEIDPLDPELNDTSSA